jgi:hypothetical protein
VTVALVLDALVLAWLLYRQRKVRRVPPRLGLRFPVLLGVLGLVEVADYSHQHTLGPAVIGVLALSLAVAAVGLGIVRALTVRVQVVDGVMLRQGTWLTVALWLISLGLHFAADWWITALKGPSGLPSASLLLYLGLTYGVQRAVVHRRATALAGRLGPIDVRADDVSQGPWSPGPSGRRPSLGEQPIEVHSEVVRRDDRPGLDGDRDDPHHPLDRRDRGDRYRSP